MYIIGNQFLRNSIRVTMKLNIWWLNMFKLKVPKENRAAIKEALKIVEQQDYEYVLTTDKNLVEQDKINIVFSMNDLPKINRIIDGIVKGEDLFVIGYSDMGQKNLEAKLIQYFIAEADDIYASVQKKRYIVRQKLYELEEMLANHYFIRVSKYALVNINRIDYIKPALNSKLILIMENGEELEVNRHYYKAFKKALKL